jgi:hypothetical protein
MLYINSTGKTKLIVTVSDMVEDVFNLVYTFRLINESNRSDIYTVELTKINEFNFNHDEFEFDNDIAELKEGYYKYEFVRNDKIIENGRAEIKETP